MALNPFCDETLHLYLPRTSPEGQRNEGSCAYCIAPAY